MASIVVVTIYCISAVISFSGGMECPAPFSPQSNDRDALSGASVNLYLDENDFQGG